MIVGINAFLCSPRAGYRRTGVHRYIQELVAALAALHEDVDVRAYVQSPIDDPRWANVHQRTAPVPVGRPPVRIAVEMAGLPFMARRDGIDLFHGPVNTLPFGLPVPGVVTVHDLAFLRFPEQVTKRRYHYLKHMIGSAVRRARMVLTPSEATRMDVIERFCLPPEKVRVTPLGVDDRYARSVGATDRPARPLVLTVGTLEPRKNLPRLIAASALLQDQIEHDLLLAGPDGWLMDEIDQAIAVYPRQDRLQRIGFVDDETLGRLYGTASVVAIPSLYEGFGLPVLEAMSAGAPVLTSNVSSLPEVAGDAAVLVDPDSVESILAGLQSFIGDPKVQAEFAERGRRRAQQYTWERTASATVAAWKDALA